MTSYGCRALESCSLVKTTFVGLLIKTFKYMLLILSDIVSFEIQFTQSHYKCNCACARLCVEVCTVGACVCIYVREFSLCRHHGLLLITEQYRKVVTSLKHSC